MGFLKVEPPPRKKRYVSKDLTPEKAAAKVQALWRCRLARRNFRVLLQSIYKKVKDPATVSKYDESDLSSPYFLE